MTKYNQKAQLDYYYRNRDKILAKKKKQDRKRMYGLTDEQYQQMLKDTQGLCEICGTVPNSISIDHDHKTGNVRGLLCKPCNMALGLFKDDPSIIEKARDYLEKFSS